MEPRWKTLVVEGKRLVLKGAQGDWTLMTCESEEEAQHKFRELHAWAKHTFEIEEFKKLC